MGSLRTLGGAVAASSLLVLGAGAHAQDLMGTSSWPVLAQSVRAAGIWSGAVPLTLTPQIVQIAQSSPSTSSPSTQTAPAPTLGTDVDQPQSPMLTGQQEAPMPRPISPLLRLPSRQPTGESVREDLDDEVQYIDPDRGETVLTRLRPELEPLGVRVGSFLLFPSFTGEEEYNSNIFATPHDAEGDLISHLQPSLILDSDWNRHRLTFRADADIGLYAENSDEDYSDYRAGVAGRLDISEGAYLTGSADYMHLHEDRDAPDNVGGKEPTEFDDIAVRAAYYQQFGRFRARLLTSFDELDFQDVPAFGGGDINNDDRDRLEAEGVFRFGYEITPETQPYVQASYNVRDYQTTDDAGFDRDSSGFSGDVGLEIAFSGVMFGDFFVGYREQDYQDSSFNTISGLDAGATLTWNVTPLTTVVGTLRRTVEETITEGSSGFFGTQVDLRVDHELLRNLILGAEVGYINRDYDGIDRTDDVFLAQLDANYMMNRYIYIKGAYKFRDRSSTDADEEYSQHIGLISLTLQY